MFICVLCNWTFVILHMHTCAFLLLDCKTLNKQNRTVVTTDSDHCFTYRPSLSKCQSINNSVRTNNTAKAIKTTKQSTKQTSFLPNHATGLTVRQAKHQILLLPWKLHDSSFTSSEVPVKNVIVTDMTIVSGLVNRPCGAASRLRKGFLVQTLNCVWYNNEIGRIYFVLGTGKQQTRFREMGPFINVSCDADP